MTKPHNHYFKDVSHLTTLDVYRVLALFNVTDPCLQHAVKKLLVAGGRGAGKDVSRDIQEAIDSCVRWQEMREEDNVVNVEIEPLKAMSESTMGFATRCVNEGFSHPCRSYSATSFMCE